MNIENRVELEDACGAKFAPVVSAISRLESNVCELTQQLVSHKHINVPYVKEP